MYKGYEIIVVTPAGRERYLEILLRHSLANRKIIDFHHLWVNTNNESDIFFIKNIAKNYPDYFKVIEATIPIKNRPVESIYQFYKGCVKKNAIYIKLDDDICYICQNAFENLIDFRIANPDPFLVYPVVVCTGQEWILDVFKPISKWKRIKSNSILEHIRRHVEFLSDPTSSRYVCLPYTIPMEESISINCICWMGSDFAEFEGKIPEWPINDETWLSSTKTKELKRPNVIDGKSVFVHFSYSHGGTMQFLETHTDLRERYLELAVEIWPDLFPKKKKLFI